MGTSVDEQCDILAALDWTGVKTEGNQYGECLRGPLAFSNKQV